MDLDAKIKELCDAAVSAKVPVEIEIALGQLRDALQEKNKLRQGFVDDFASKARLPRTRIRRTKISRTEHQPHPEKTAGDLSA
jgi:hypothetical protein